MSQSIQSGLNKFCARKFGAPAETPQLITGGANMEMWSFSCASKDYVLRRYRNGKRPQSSSGHFGIEGEGRLIEFARDAGVMAPEFVGTLHADDGLGPGFVMVKADGIALPQKLFKDPRYKDSLSKMTESFGRELAYLHASDPAPVEDMLVALSPADCFAKMLDDFALSQFQNPVLAAAMHWLEANLPTAEDDLVVLHGDFRMGNLLIDEKGLSAVLDWELAHLGCVEEDLAYICMPSWRFGRYHLEAGGVGTREDLIDSYERHSKRKVDRKRFDWYLVFSSMKWGLMTSMMARMWRGNEDKSLERILIGTRISEVETDLLLMLESIADIGGDRNITFQLPQPSAIGGDVAPEELMNAIGSYLSESIIPKQSGADRFYALIANNALSIASREVTYGPAIAENRAGRLDTLGHSESSLFKALRSGAADWRDPGILLHMRALCLERLSIHQPKYAALSVALEKWGADTNV